MLSTRRIVPRAASLLRSPLLLHSVTSNPCLILKAALSSSTKMAPKEEGTIASVFASLAGEAPTALPDKFKDLKKMLAGDSAKREHIWNSWVELNSALKSLNEDIRAKQQEIVPQIMFDEFINASNDNEVVKDIKKRGVVVIKGVVSKDQALEWKEDIRQYCRDHPAKGFPANDPQVWELYWTPAQLAARSHPNFLAMSTRLNTLFTVPTASTLLTQPLTYADRLRIRHPGDSSFALGPHMDGGSVERWEDPIYRSVYNEILEGRWEDYDPFELGKRAEATMSLYDAPGGCSMMRTFQGWLSMSETGPGEGTLRVYPGLKESTSYLMLRPLFRELVGGGWEWDLESSEFPGSALGRGQEFDGTFGVTHPGLELASCMVSAPKVEPGDAVLWHCDTIHAVESAHQGPTDASVLYIPTVPLTLSNARYLAHQRGAFVAGTPAPDFPGGQGESAFAGRGKADHLKDLEARRAMGLEALVAEGEAEALVKECNRILGLKI